VNQNGAARARRAGTISATLVSRKSAELLYEPSERSIEIEMRFREFVILFDIWGASYFRGDLPLIHLTIGCLPREAGQ
jgi:hypothetical protein